MLEAGVPFPDFSLPDQNGRTHRLADYAGQWLVVYFYPKDNTAACTLEAVDFTAAVPAFAAHHTAVLGVSPDSVKSHAGFTAQKELGVTLLSDPEHRLLTAAGVWQKKKLYGKEHMGVVRSTCIVDPGGIVRASWAKVKVPEHVDAVLAKLEALRKEG